MHFSKAVGLSAVLPLWLSFLHSVSAAQWNIVQYNIVYMTVSVGDIDSFTFTDTTTITLEPPVTSTPGGRPTSIDTSYDAEEDASYTTLYIPGSAVPSQVFASLTATATGYVYTTTPITEYYMDRVYTAPASCPSLFTFTTSDPVFIPEGAETNLTPTSASTTTSADGDVYVTAYLSPGAVNITSTLTTSDFIQSEYIASCTTPIAFVSGSYAYPSSYYYNPNLHSGGDDYDYGYDDHFGCLGSLCPFWLIYIVVIVPVLAFLFLGGLIESYYWFTRLMKGQSALRGVPLMWVCISLWTLCCLRRHRAAHPEHQAALLKQWRDMSSGQHIKLWLSYGFRHRDPPQLTEIVGKQPVVPVWQSYPPQSYPAYGPPQGGMMGPGPPPGQPPMGPQQPQQWQQAAPGWTPQSGYSPYENKSPYSPPPAGSPPPQFQGYTYLPPQQQQQQMQQMQQGPAPGQQPTEAYRGSSIPSPATSPSNAPAESIPHTGVSAATPPPPGPVHGAMPEVQQPVPMQPVHHVEAPADGSGGTGHANEAV